MDAYPACKGSRGHIRGGETEVRGRGGPRTVPMWTIKAGAGTRHVVSTILSAAGELTPHILHATPGQKTGRGRWDFFCFVLIFKGLYDLFTALPPHSGGTGVPPAVRTNAIG